MRITAVTCVKNEGPFLLEWIAFNRVIGVTDFLFYSNDCSDGTDHLLDALQDHGIVKHLPNPAEGRAYQMEALKHAARQEFVISSDWLWIADVDEFLNIHVGNGTIPELISACGDVKAISLSFQFFASGDVETYEDRPVIEQFCYSHNPDIWCESTSIEVKSLMRRDFPLQYIGAHRPFFRKGMPESNRPAWSNGSGEALPDVFRLGAEKQFIRKFNAKGARKFATLNHYALRSLDSYLVKNDRGDVNREKRQFDDTYWRERNDDGYEDRSIQKYLPALNEEVERLKNLPNIRKLHDISVVAHKATLARLMEDADYVALRETLQKTPRIPPQEAALLELIG